MWLEQDVGLMKLHSMRVKQQIQLFIVIKIKQYNNTKQYSIPQYSKIKQYKPIPVNTKQNSLQNKAQTNTKQTSTRRIYLPIYNVSLIEKTFSMGTACRIINQLCIEKLQLSDYGNKNASIQLKYFSCYVSVFWYIKKWTRMRIRN